MTAIPNLKPIPRGVPLIPAACWDKSIPVHDGLSGIECDGLVELLLPWLYGGPGRDGVYLKIFAHLRTCPVCIHTAESLPEKTVDIDKTWIPKGDDEL